MLVSMLLPSRDRPEKMLKSVTKLIETSIAPEQIEICVRVDEDDPSTLAVLHKLYDIHTNIKIRVGDRMDGYESLHHMYNELAEISTGTFLYLWNDDSYMKTEGWDLILSDYTDKCSWIMTGTHYDYSSFNTSFPCIHRKLWEVMGRFAAHPHNDTYQCVVMQLFENQWEGIRKYVLPHNDLTNINSGYTLAVNCTTGGIHQEDETIEIEHSPVEKVNHPENFERNTQMFNNMQEPVYQEIIDDVMKLIKYFASRGGDFSTKGGI